MITISFNKYNNKYNAITNTIMDSLTHIQKKAIKYSRKKSKCYHKSTWGNVKCRFLELGHNLNDLEEVIEYIKNRVKIIIHIKLDKLYPYIKSDTHYRNQFETNAKGSLYTQSRVMWENARFGNIYGDTTDNGSERVKYGCLNMYSQKSGCAHARTYGSSYIVLNDDVRSRATFVSDCSKKEIHMCTFDYFGHLLLYASNEMINNLVKISKSLTGEFIDFEIKNVYPNIEIQIHGDIIFARDVDKIMVDRATTAEAIQALIDKNIKFEYYN